MKSIEEIKREYSAKAVAAMNARSARIAELASLRRPAGDDYYLDRLDDAQRREILAEQKAALDAEDRDRLRREYRQAHDAYAKDIAERRDFLNSRLFGVEGADSAALLARAALASEDELSSLLDVAAQSGNLELGRVAFLTAHRRGLGDLTHRYLTEVDPEARVLYDEFSEAPSSETVERQAQDIDQMIPPASPEQLAGTPLVNS